jgi:hypothetical protein
MRQMFNTVRVAFFLVLAALIVSMFLPQKLTNLQIGFTCIDALLGWSWRTIVVHLYPPPPQLPPDPDSTGQPKKRLTEDSATDT